MHTNFCHFFFFSLIQKLFKLNFQSLLCKTQIGCIKGVGDESVNSEQLPVNSEEKLVTDNWSLITENTDN